MDEQRPTMGRRRFLKLTSRGALAAGTVPVVGGLLAACGDDDAPAATTAAPAATTAAPAATTAAPTTTTSLEDVMQAGLAEEKGDLVLYAFGGTENHEVWNYDYSPPLPEPTFTNIPGSFASLAVLDELVSLLEHTAD